MCSCLYIQTTGRCKRAVLVHCRSGQFWWCGLRCSLFGLPWSLATVFLARIYEASGKRLWIVASFCDMSWHGLFVCSDQLAEHSWLTSTQPAYNFYGKSMAWICFVFSEQSAQCSWLVWVSSEQLWRANSSFVGWVGIDSFCFQGPVGQIFRDLHVCKLSSS